MTNYMIPWNLVIPSVIGLGFGLIAAYVLIRRGLEKRALRFFISYLIVAAAWLLFVGQGGLKNVWPGVLWGRVANYVVLGLGVVYWGFARAFWQRSRLPVAGLLPVVGAAVFLLLLDTGLLAVPTGIIEMGLLVRALSVGSAALYVGLAVVIALSEFGRRSSPLHRNRILFWLSGTVAVIAGSALVVINQPGASIAGAGIHLLGAALVAYVVVQPQLPILASRVRRAISTLSALTITVVAAVGLGRGVVYLLGMAPFFRLQFADSILFNAVIGGLLVFLLYQPLGGLVRRGMERLLGGQDYGAEHVVREYSRALGRLTSLEMLAVTAMGIVDDALGVQRGTLFVVEDHYEAGWRLRVLAGLDVAPDLRPLWLAFGTTMANWLVVRGAPLFQYTLDVDPRFEDLDEMDHRAWRRLGMELFVPIRRSDALIGVLALGLRRSDDPYGESELELLATLADQTAVALENARLFSRLEQRADQLAVLNRMGQLITAAVDREAILQLIAARLGNSLDVAAGFIYLVGENEDELVVESAFGPQAPEKGSFRVAFGQGAAGWAAARRRSIIITDLDRDDRASPAIEGALLPGARTALGVPIVARGETLGLILLLDRRRGVLSANELNLLESVASFASVALENSRLFADLHHNLDDTLAMKNLMDGVFTSIISGVITIDLDSRITFLNSAAERIFSLSASTVVGQSHDIVFEVFGLEFEGLIRSVKEDGRPRVGYEITVDVPGRGALNLRLSLAPLKDAQNTTTGMTIVIDDLTEQRQLEVEHTRIRRIFERVVAPQVVESLLSNPGSLELGGLRQELTILFADVRRFTTFSERMPPEMLIVVLNEYLSLAGQAVLEQEGTLDKFMGDAVMAIFNAPVIQPDHPLRAVRAALHMREALEAHRNLLDNTHRLYFGVGINVGDAVVGNVGTPELFNYTAIGDAVNLAKRLQENAAPGQILLSETTYRLVRDVVETRALELMKMKGRSKLEQVYEVIRLKPGR